MTETNLREILVATARAYMGANTYNGQKQEIIDIYNKNQPRPIGYKVQYRDAQMRPAGVPALSQCSRPM